MQLRIAADLLLFKPSVGCALVGKVQKVGSDYVSMLVLGVFNAVLLAKDIDKKFLPLASGALADGAGAGDADADDAKKKKRRKKEGKQAAAATISEGCLLKFKVAQLKVEGDMLTIVGAMKEKGLGPYTP